MIFYQASVTEILTQLKTDPLKGLDETEIPKRQAENGLNIIKTVSKRSGIRIFLQQFADLLVMLLIVAGLIALYLGEYRDTVIMFLIVAINALIGFFQEYKAERIVESLKNLVKKQTRVIRNGHEYEISTDQLVPGDIVLLEEGVGVGADMRLLETESFATNDFILTGESDPQPKESSLTITETTPVTDQNNCVFTGVTVARGFAKGVVFATGMQTEIGKIAEHTENIQNTSSPLQREIGMLAKTITWMAGVLTIMLFLVQILIMKGGIESAFIFAIGIAVSMVPQGLPAQISVALSLGTGRMARQRAVVKKLSAIETLGCATVIATDKTGTITKNEMSIVSIYINGTIFSVTGSGYAPQGEIVDADGKTYTKERLQDLKVFFLDGYLASTGRVNPPDTEHATWYPLGDPTEAAFATLAMKAGYELGEVEKEYPKVRVFPFDSQRKRMTVLREHTGKHIAFLKGGIESILEVSNQLIQNNTVRPLNDEDRKRLLELVKTYAAEGKRVIALAYRDMGERATSQHSSSLAREEPEEGQERSNQEARIKKPESGEEESAPSGGWSAAADRGVNLENKYQPLTKHPEDSTPLDSRCQILDTSPDSPLPTPFSQLPTAEIEQAVTFAGFAVMQDPPHEEVRPALREAFAASLKIVMITGDNAVTAKAIANEIGMTAEGNTIPTVVNGDELKAMSDPEVGRFLERRAIIFSRVSPDDKLRIVSLLRERGEIVAVTGDGVNDTLSLKQADIGVAMGQKGAEVAKEAADMVLLDDNFSTVVVAIREGRTIYKNLEKTILATLCANFGELTCVLLGFIGTAFFELPMAILAIQILSVDLIGEVLPLTMLTFDPPEAALMKRAPRDVKSHIVTQKRLKGIIFSGFLIGLLAFLSFLAVYHWNTFDGTNLTARAQTAAYVSIVFIQLTNIMSSRSGKPIWNKYFFSNTKLLLSLLISIVFVLVIVYVPLVNAFLHTAPLLWQDWLYPVGGAFVLLVLNEFVKTRSKRE